MKLKPKTSVHNPRALLYRRFTDLEKSYSLRVGYKTADDKMWLFDGESGAFVELNGAVPTSVVNVTANTYLQYKGNYYHYADGLWVVSESYSGTLLSAQFGNIAKYQTNKYYFVGSFDYMIKGSLDSVDTQVIKGNIMALTSFTVRTFDDSLKLDHDDLVVIDGRLFAIEDLETSPKRMPKPYNVYFATLNSIL